MSKTDSILPAVYHVPSTRAVGEVKGRWTHGSSPGTDAPTSLYLGPRERGNSTWRPQERLLPQGDAVQKTSLPDIHSESRDGT